MGKPIWDVFLFSYETDAARVRQIELEGLVRHVPVELTHTLRGERRALTWLGVWPQPSVTIEPPLVLEPMAMEQWTRRQFGKTVLPGLGAEPDDLVIVGDCDEIPSRTQLAEAVEFVEATGKPVKLHTDYRELKADWRAPDSWQLKHQAYLARFDTVCADMQAWRQGGITDMIHGGWHLSSMGGPANVALKLQTFSHPEADPTGRYSQPEWLQHCTNTGRDLLDRFDCEPVPHEPGRLPDCILHDKTFAHLLRAPQQTPAPPQSEGVVSR